MATDQLSDLITQAEAARLRNVSREAIYGLVARGKLQVVEIGGQKFVRRSEVENYIPEVGGRPRAEAKSQPVDKAGNHNARKRAVARWENEGGSVLPKKKAGAKKSRRKVV